MYVHAAGRDLVQQRLPQVGLVLVYQGDRGASRASEVITGAGRELEASCAAPDDDELMWATHCLGVIVERRLL